jgi:rubredoxin
MARYRCIVCGYVYDESRGDAGHGIKKGTKFSALPGDWVCPICGVGKDQFEKLGDRT